MIYTYDRRYRYAKEVPLIYTYDCRYRYAKEVPLIYTYDCRYRYATEVSKYITYWMYSLTARNPVVLECELYCTRSKLKILFLCIPQGQLYIGEIGNRHIVLDLQAPIGRPTITITKSSNAGDTIVDEIRFQKNQMSENNELY